MLVQFQDDSEKVITYSSRSLTETEKEYSQIERECLAIYFGCFRFQMYITGKAFTVCSDHIPLMHIFNNLKRTTPFRIERMRLKLQGFSFKVEHVSGITNPSAYTSRHPLPTDPEDDTCITGELTAQVRQVWPCSLKAATLDEIRAAAEEDELMNKISKLIEDRYPSKNDEVPSAFYRI